MKKKVALLPTLALVLSASTATLTMAMQSGPGTTLPPRPQGPCDIYAAAGDACAAAHSSTRALYASYNGPLYQVLRQSDGKTLDIGVVQPVATPVRDAGGYANAAAQDAFCANAHCFVSILYDQSPNRNHLVQAPRGGFSGPSMGGFNNLPFADMSPITIMGHKAYGVFIAPGMGLRQNDAKGTAVDDQAEGQYWVINGRHFNSGCCFDYGNAETDSRDDDNGTMETTYYGNATAWYRGSGSGPWIMTDQENNLVGCVNPDGTKACANLKSIAWRFVTGIAKGEPHHWSSMGGDAQNGTLSVLYDGPRVDFTYDPMRKQGAILLGNGGDNSVGSQGTFYEGAMTASGTYPTHATDQLVQANIVTAKYDVQRLSIAPSSATPTPPGLQTFSPGTSQDSTLTFTNTTGAPVTGVKLSLTVPRHWHYTASNGGTSSAIAEPVAPGASMSATFKITSGPAAFNGDLVGTVSWKNPNGSTQSEKTAEKVRNVAPVKINEFRVSDGSPSDSTNSFIELYNAGSAAVDISNWALTQHPTQQAIFSSIKIPPATKLAAGGFYLLGLSNSALAAGSRAGDTAIFVRSTTGMSVGDTITIDTGFGEETRRIITLGTPAAAEAPLWQPVPDGPVITIPVGSTNVPVTGEGRGGVTTFSGFAVGEKIGIGYGATYPTTGRAIESYEVATVIAIGKPGTQAYLGVDAHAGATNIKVTALGNISVGDSIRLDIDAPGYGIETVIVTRVGTASNRTALAADAIAGATSIKVRSAAGFVAGDKLTIGTPATRETVTITTVSDAGVDFQPALANPHPVRDFVVAHGTGLDLAAALKFKHAANMPFSARGTGLGFIPATAFPHSSNEPVQPLGSGITLDKPLAKAHVISAVVRNEKVTTVGYRGGPVPNQWFGGPVLSPAAGAMILRDAAGLVVDSLNYGHLVDPWAAEGYQATSGSGVGGCDVATPGPVRGGFGGPAATGTAPNRSAGRFPDGHDTDSNCTDFLVQSATNLSAPSAPGDANIKVAAVANFEAGQTLTVDPGANAETALIAQVGTAGGTTIATATSAGATTIRVASSAGFAVGQTITLDTGEKQETAVITALTRPGRGGVASTITVAALKSAHSTGAPVSGSGITFASALTKAHNAGVQVTNELPTPGAPNKYQSRSRR
jgi:hypothetical protein